MLRSQSFSDKMFDVINLTALFLIAAAMFFPFYYMIIVSFSSNADFLNSSFVLWPKHFVTYSYQYIFASIEFIRSIKVTVFITVVGTIVNLILTTTMAYALSRDIPGRRFFTLIVLITFLFNGGMIPTYLIVQKTGLINSLWSLIIPNAINAFDLILIRSFFMNIPKELIEAAIMDGANEIRIFTSIVLKLSKPVLAAFGLFYAVMHWNTFFDAILYLNDSSKWTLQVILREIVIMGDAKSALHQSAEAVLYQRNHPPPPETIGMAAILVATVPILFVYPFLQKHFAKGVMLGSIKG